MIRNAIFAAGVCWLAIIMWLLDDLRYLQPYRDLIIQRHVGHVAFYLLPAFFNTVAIFYLFNRKIALKGTGEKLRRIDVPEIEP